MGGKQTIFCLRNSHRSHKHKLEINKGAESRLRSRRGKAAASLWLVGEVCTPLLCSQDDLPRSTPDQPPAQSWQRQPSQNGSLQLRVTQQQCVLDLILSRCLCRIIIPNTIRQTCQESPLKAGFVSEASFCLPEQYTDPCMCFRSEDTDSFLPLLPSGKHHP